MSTDGNFWAFTKLVFLVLITGIALMVHRFIDNFTFYTEE